MNALARFEGLMQRLVEGRMVRILGGELQPMELANALARHFDRLAHETPRGQAIPASFRLLIHPEDAAKLDPVVADLEAKLRDCVVELARERSLNFAELPVVEVVPAEAVQRAAVEVQTRQERTGHVVEAAADTVAEEVLMLAVAGTLEAVTVTHLPFSIGRGADNDLVLPDPAVSRRHASLQREAGDFILRDLHSRNGTRLNGQLVQAVPLRQDDEIALGQVRLVVRRMRRADQSAPF